MGNSYLFDTAEEISVSYIGMEPIDLLTLPPAGLEALVGRWGEPAYRGRQLATWLYRRGATTFAEMTNLPLAFRRRVEAECSIVLPTVSHTLPSSDGSRKFVFSLADGLAIESVLIPDEDRLTLCLSTQVGCGYACRFCYTGVVGLKRNLTAGEMVGQVLQVRKHLKAGERISHLVLMGMGEPLANYQATVAALRTLTCPQGLGFSAKRVTLSTVGLAGGIERLAEDGIRVNLAISLHAATDELRSRLMPANRAFPLAKLLAACRSFPLPVRQRMTFEYVLLAGVNDSPEDARRLTKLLAGLRCKVNLIPFNPWPGSEFSRPSEERVQAFQQVLHDSRLTATIRWSRGDDIGAACGQLGESLIP